MSEPSAQGSLGRAALLFAATAVTTTLALGPVGAATLLAILVAHEMGHFVVARAHGVPVSPPYFIPLPGLGVGTLGAVIAMGADRADRDQLMRIAVAGPFAGVIVAVPLLMGAAAAPAELVALEGDVLVFGRSLLSGAIEDAFAAPPPPGFEREGSPMFLAAWLGLFITGLNLLPVGQLDGGHALHAMTPRHSAAIGRAVWIALLVLGGLGMMGLVPLWLGEDGARWIEPTRGIRRAFSPIYLVWAVLTTLFGRRHPPIRDEHRPLTPSSRALGIAAALLLAAVFVPSGVWADRLP